MAVRTVVFSVQLGTDGLAIAQTVAARMGFNYLDWNDTSRAAIASGISPDVVAEFERDRPKLISIVQRLLTSASMLNDDVSSDATVNPAVMSWAMNSLDSSSYRSFVEDMVRELDAQGGSVIVGHAAQVVLRDSMDAFKVLVCGDEELRAERFSLESGQGPESALRSVRKADRERRDFYKRVYGVDAMSPALYDLTINSSRIPKDAAIEVILAGIRAVGVEAAIIERRDAATVEETTAPYGLEVPPTSEEDALRRARIALELAISTEGKALDAVVLQSRVKELHDVFALHISEAEGPDGTLADAVQKKPYLEPRARRLRQEHIRIMKALSDFHHELGSTARADFDAEAVRAHGTRVLVSLRLHEASGFDLLYEAYVRDEGGE